MLTKLTQNHVIALTDDMNYIFLYPSSQRWKFDVNWYHEVSCWPGPAGSFLLTLASLGKEWPSFLWTRHCVRSPGSGRPFHFMVHRPCVWLCRAFRCRGGNVSWNWCPCQQLCGSPSFCRACQLTDWWITIPMWKAAPPLFPAHWPWQQMRSRICYRGNALLASFALAEWKSNGLMLRRSW